jgi:zinc protease
LRSRIALALLGSFPALVSAAAPDAVRREVLPNGLTVLVLPEPGTPFVSVGTMYRVGARNEAAGTTGLAHYCEHMNFRATRRFPGHETTESITRRGGRWSGYTWIDQTWYRSTMEKDALDHLLALEADRMAEALYEPAAFDQERTSVLAELRSYDDPHSVLYDAVLAASFEIHPYRNNTIGYPSDVEGVTRDEAYRFYRRFYHPNNAVLAVASGLAAEEVLARVRERFGGLAGQGESTAVRTLEPAQTGQRRVTVRKPGPHARLLVAFRAPALLDRDFPAMVLLDALLAGGKGFRLLEKYPAPGGTPLDEALKGLITEGSTAWQASPYPYVYSFSASVPKAEGLEASEAAFFRLLGQAAKREWTDAEKSAAIRQVKRGWARDLDEQGERIHQLAFFEVAGSWRELYDLPERLQRVETADLQRFVRERLRPDRATVGWFVPEAPTPEAPSAPEASGLSPSGSLGSSPSATAPPTPRDLSVSVSGPPRSFALPGGSSLKVVPVAGTFLVALRGRWPAGPAPEGVLAVAVEHLSTPLPAEDPTVPALSWTLLDDPEAPVNGRAVEVTASGLAEDVPGLLRALAGRLEAVLPEGDGWERLRLSARRRAEERAATLSTALWARALAELHPAESAASRPPWGSPDAVSAVRRPDAALFLREGLGPLLLVVAGKASPEDVRRAAPTLPVTGIRATSRPRPSARGPAAWTERRLPWPGSAQNEILVAWPGDRSKGHDRAATAALLYLLGETYYSGRLGRALVEPGLVYSVNTTLENDLLVVRTAVAPRDTAEALRRTRAVLEDVGRGAFGEADLAEARAYLRGKAARGREGALANAAAAAEGPPETAEGLTLAQLNDTARRLFRNGAPLALVGGPGY